MSVLHAGEIDKTIQYFPNPQPPSPPAANPVSLTGLTVTMKIQRPDTGAVNVVTMTVSSDGTNATYATQAGDFPVPGNYILQFFAASGTSLLWKSDEVSQLVGSSL